MDNSSIVAVFRNGLIGQIFPSGRTFTIGFLKKTWAEQRLFTGQYFGQVVRWKISGKKSLKIFLIRLLMYITGREETVFTAGIL